MNGDLGWVLVWIVLAVLVVVGLGTGWASFVEILLAWSGGVASYELYARHKGWVVKR